MIQLVEAVKEKVEVKLSGVLTADEALKLRDKLSEHIERGHTHVIIDMEDVQFIHSSGLGVILLLQKEVMKVDGKVVIKNPNSLIKQVFEITRLNKVIHVECKE